MEKQKITSYEDLDVYKRAYSACLIVMKYVVQKLPANEKYDLGSQLSRSCKAVPRLIAEGFAKKHQRAGFQKYLDDAMSETNETHVGVCQCKDLYFKEIDINVCVEMINEYKIIGKQLFRLSEAWSKFSKTLKDG